MSPERKPGDPGWKPSEEDVRAAQQPQGGLLLRVVSVVPFIGLGALGVLALVSWVAVMVLGVGTGRGAVWTWARGRSAGDVLAQVALMLLIGAACAALTGLAIFATAYGVRPRQPAFFWRLSAAFFAGLVVLLAWGRAAYPALMRDLGLAGVNWWFVSACLVFSVAVAGLRLRLSGQDGVDDGDE